MHVRALPARGGARRPTHYRIGLAHRRTSSCAARPATASDSCSNNERTNAPSAVRRSAAIAPSTHAARVLTPDRCSGPPGPRGPYCSACLCGRQKIMQQTDNTTHTTLVTRWRRSPADVLNPSPGQRRLQRRWQRSSSMRLAGEFHTDIVAGSKNRSSTRPVPRHSKPSTVRLAQPALAKCANNEVPFWSQKR